MKKKKLVSTLLAAIMAVALLGAPALADAAPSAPQTAGTAQSSAAVLPDGKDEVVYASLSPTGSLRGIYVVNILQVAQTGVILDYGSYDSVKNLTDLAEMKQDGDRVLTETKPGKFYYQGNMDKGNLPWTFSVTYFLDGVETDPALLGGKSGYLEIQIHSKTNPAVNPVFFDHYLLQISLTMDGTVCDNLMAPSGTIANAGEDQMVTFTSLPGKEGNFQLSCDVTDFVFSGIDIAAVPFQMSFELPSTKQITGDLSELSKAVDALKDGITDLHRGIASLSGGASALTSGSADYQNGLHELDGQSAQLTKASQSILDGMHALSAALSDPESGNLNLGALAQLPDGLTQLSGNLRQIGGGLSTVREGYVSALSALETAINGIPAGTISQTELQALAQKAPNDPTLQKLIDAYTAAVTVKETYAQLRDGFYAVDSSLSELGGSITPVADALDNTAKQISTAMEGSGLSASLSQLQSGIDNLTSSYTNFHAGLERYTAGVGALAGSYAAVQSGLADLTGGATGLNQGAGTLQSGAETLAGETETLPDRMEAEIQKLADSYDNSDFQPVSFVSDKNTEIGAVSFVIKLDGIERPEPQDTSPKSTERDTFWSRLLALFQD